jgi:hypothetical protein
MAARTNSLVRKCQFTNSVRHGKLWYGDFYGQGSHEIIIGDDNDFDVKYIVANWQLATPVRLLTHAISDFGLALPNGDNNHFVRGLAVIYINIPMLFLQYRLFVEDQMRKKTQGNDDAVISPKLFLYRYVLPGMMVSHLDHVFVNRIINLEDGAPMTEMLKRSNFFQAESGNQEDSGIVDKVNKAQEQILEKLTTSQTDYETALANIFVPSHDDALTLLKMPVMAPTRQLWWAFLLARLKHTKFLFKLSVQTDSHQTRVYNNAALLNYSRLLDSHVLEQMLPADILENTVDEIKEVLDLASR